MYILWPFLSSIYKYFGPKVYTIGVHGLLGHSGEFAARDPHCSIEWGYSKGPCAQIVYTLAPKYLSREYFKAKVYAIWAHGPLGLTKSGPQILAH